MIQIKEISMNEKRIFKALTSTLVLAVGAKLSLHAQ